jgi:hypothetical protein
LNRINKLLSLKLENKIKIILVQINEAHSSEWPMYIDNQPDPQQNFNERLERANLFINKYEIYKYNFIEVYVDGWDNKFDNMFQLWPDKYYLIKNNIVVKKSGYHTNGNLEATIIDDYVDVLSNLF